MAEVCNAVDFSPGNYYTKACFTLPAAFLIRFRKDHAGGYTLLYEHIKNNYAEISGKIESELEFSHKAYGVDYYSLRVRSNRLSRASDVVPLLFPEDMIDISQSYVGQQISASGQFRSFNRWINGHSCLLLYLSVKAYAFSEDDLTESNMIYLDGYLCKEPIFRITPRGKEICELILAVNREFKKTDYIPCICWGREARFASRLGVGSHVRIWGRMQSRIYYKKVADKSFEPREAFEISVNSLEEMDPARFHIGKVAEGRSNYYENTASQRHQ